MTTSKLLVSQIRSQLSSSTVGNCSWGIAKQDEKCWIEFNFLCWDGGRTCQSMNKMIFVHFFLTFWCNQTLLWELWFYKEYFMQKDLKMELDLILVMILRKWTFSRKTSQIHDTLEIQLKKSLKLLKNKLGNYEFKSKIAQ